MQLQLVKSIPNLSPRTKWKFWCQLFKWITVWSIVALRLVGIVLFLIWACDCFFREFRTTIACRHFPFFRNPQLLITLWLMITVLLTITLCIKLPCSKSIGAMFFYLLKRKYFYKISFMFALVIVYDTLILLDHPDKLKTLQYVSFMFEDISLYLLMLRLNFTPRFISRTDTMYFIRLLAYKATLALYSLECLSIYICGTTIVFYHILTISTCSESSKINNETILSDDTFGVLRKPEPHEACLKHDYVTVVELLLLINSNAFRYIIGDFFLSKLFAENNDVLGGGRSLF